MAADLLEFGSGGVIPFKPPASTNLDFLDFGVKGVPPASKNHDFLDFGTQRSDENALNEHCAHIHRIHT